MIHNSQAAPAQGEWQLTFSPIPKSLDDNDNFSADNRFLVYDTRDTFGAGLGNATSIMKVSVATGLENYVYAPKPFVTGAKAAPGMGAPSFSPIGDEVIFIHGPFLSETATRGFYGFTNRRAGLVRGDGGGEISFLDCRDVTSDVTPPGAHRGGSHRHEYSADGQRIGFTYDDHFLTQYGRNIAMMVRSPKAPCGGNYWTTVLAPIVPVAESKPGDLERAADDSWVGSKGLMRAFIGNVKEADGSVMRSLFVVDIPADVDFTTSYSGTRTKYMTPPKGTTIRRLTSTPALGIVRGSLDGSRIAYYAMVDGVRQVFVIPSLGSDRHADPAMRPVQVTRLEHGASSSVRWHPSGNSLAVLSDNGVAVVCVKPGPLFGKTHWLTRHGADAPATDGLVWSRDGRLLAFNRRVPIRQIFLVAFPDANNNGVADPIE